MRYFFAYIYIGSFLYLEGRDERFFRLNEPTIYRYCVDLKLVYKYEFETFAFWSWLGHLQEGWQNVLDVQWKALYSL